jgi:hypothetical protein
VADRVLDQPKINPVAEARERMLTRIITLHHWY